MADPQLTQIQQQVAEAQHEFDQWMSSVHENFATKQADHKRAVLTSKDNIKALREQIASKANEKQANEKVAKKQEAARQEIEGKIEAVEKETEQLSRVDQKLDEEVEALRQERQRILDEMEAVKKDHISASARKTQGIAWFQDRLGWSMKTRKRDTLSMCFTQLDPDAPERKFQFDLIVKANDTYEVAHVEPATADIASLLPELNTDNNLGRFLVRARAVFKATLTP
eukprot:m.32433 g.32433  ORF g.32433 m.32433 type:complete len:227 (+) comp10787_c0_seq1:86-766(+)